MERLTNTKDRCTTSASALEDSWQRVRRRIEEAAPHLVKQGVIVAKTGGRRRVFVLRFRRPEQGRNKLKSIYLCEDNETKILARAQAMLDLIRGPAHWSKEVAAYARCARAARALVKRLTGK
jgi:hypothetical protein